MTTLKNVNYKSSKVRICEPYPLTRTISVKPKDAGTKLLDYLRLRFPYISGQEWTHRIKKNWIWFDDGPSLPGSSLAANQIIYHHSPAVKEPAVPDSACIIEEQDDWLMVYKPAPMPMHQGGRYYKNTLTYILADWGYTNLHVVHRLDAVTSGLVLFAKNRTLAGALQQEFAAGNVSKWYHARVVDMPDKPLTIDLPIRRKKGFVFECGRHLHDAKPAVTSIEPHTSHRNYSIVTCRPLTGRTHQIRLHLREAGHPIIDDPIYGPGGDSSGSRLQNRSISLQSSGIEIPSLSIRGEIGLPEHWLNEDGNAAL